VAKVSLEETFFSSGRHSVTFSREIRSSFSMEVMLSSFNIATIRQGGIPYNKGSSCSPKELILKMVISFPCKQRPMRAHARNKKTVAPSNWHTILVNK
jgi:hypothetical protein